MRAALTISVSNAAAWRRVREELRIRLEDVPINFTDTSIKWRPNGFSIDVPMSHAERAAHAVDLSGLPCVVDVRPILPQEDPVEQSLMRTLYPAGDTRGRDEKPKDRYPPSRSVAERRSEREARKRRLH